MAYYVLQDSRLAARPAGRHRHQDEPQPGPGHRELWRGDVPLSGDGHQPPAGVQDGFQTLSAREYAPTCSILLRVKSSCETLFSLDLSIGCFKLKLKSCLSLLPSRRLVSL